VSNHGPILLIRCQSRQAPASTGCWSCCTASAVHDLMIDPPTWSLICAFSTTNWSLLLGLGMRRWNSSWKFPMKTLFHQYSQLYFWQQS
jgi:hypothetical protein